MQVERTRSRPLAAGTITPLAALVFLGAQLSASLAILLQLNTYTQVCQDTHPDYTPTLCVGKHKRLKVVAMVVLVCIRGAAVGYRLS